MRSSSPSSGTNSGGGPKRFMSSGRVSPRRLSPIASRVSSESTAKRQREDRRGVAVAVHQMLGRVIAHGGQVVHAPSPVDVLRRIAHDRDLSPFGGEAHQYLHHAAREVLPFVHQDAVEDRRVLAAGQLLQDLGFERGVELRRALVDVRHAQDRAAEFVVVAHGEPLPVGRDPLHREHAAQVRGEARVVAGEEHARVGLLVEPVVRARHQEDRLAAAGGAVDERARRGEQPRHAFLFVVEEEAGELGERHAGDGRGWDGRGASSRRSKKCVCGSIAVRTRLRSASSISNGKQTSQRRLSPAKQPPRPLFVLAFEILAGQALVGMDRDASLGEALHVAAGHVRKRHAVVDRQRQSPGKLARLVLELRHPRQSARAPRSSPRAPASRGGSRDARSPPRAPRCPRTRRAGSPARSSPSPPAPPRRTPGPGSRSRACAVRACPPPAARTRPNAHHPARACASGGRRPALRPAWGSTRRG